jgi:hypothetical protein
VVCAVPIVATTALAVTTAVVIGMIVATMIVGATVAVVVGRFVVAATRAHKVFVARAGLYPGAPDVFRIGRLGLGFQNRARCVVNDRLGLGGALDRFGLGLGQAARDFDIAVTLRLMRSDDLVGRNRSGHRRSKRQHKGNGGRQHKV